MIRLICEECGKSISILNCGEKVECKQCGLTQKRVYFEDRWNNGGSFMRKLCDTITVSDMENLRKLHKAFPELVEGYVVYISNKSWEDYNNGEIS